MKQNSFKSQSKIQAERKIKRESYQILILLSGASLFLMELPPFSEMRVMPLYRLFKVKNENEIKTNYKNENPNLIDPCAFESC